jgi:hypothetical protein
MVLDTCAFGPFFNRDNKDHADFHPAFDWVISKKGKLVYGGTKYMNELKAAKKFISLFAQLERAGKLVILNREEVDATQDLVEEMESSPDFDDPHLIAIVIVSKCRIVCTRDARAIPFLKERKFYKGRMKRPLIYTSRTNAPLLCDRFIAEVCQPCPVLPRRAAEQLIPQ